MTPDDKPATAEQIQAIRRAAASLAWYILSVADKLEGRFGHSQDVRNEAARLLRQLMEK